jgi:hypothetical protein
MPAFTTNGSKTNKIRDNTFFIVLFCYILHAKVREKKHISKFIEFISDKNSHVFAHVKEDNLSLVVGTSALNRSSGFVV